MSLTARILLALVAGLLTGVAVARLAPAAQGDVLGVATTIGTAWIGGLRMTIVPLVFGLLVTGLASAAETARAGGVAGRALVVFAIGLAASAIVSGLIVQAILAAWPVPPAALGALGVATSAVPPEATAITGEWLLSFIPVNPIKAASEGEMVPLIVFALVFGMAVTRLPRERGARFVEWFETLVETLLIVVRWVLWLAPIGVFALATAAGARAGVAAAGALAQYVTIVVVACVSVTLLAYPAVALFGRIGIARFARAVAPAQAIAFSTQSSIASLPAMIEAARGPLGIAEGPRNVVLPMAVSIFRVTSAAANFAVALYVAALHGIAIGPALFAIGALVATIVSLAAVGLPSQVSFFTAIGPVCLAMGVPIEVLPLLLAVETVPDIFRTVGNVTADLAVARIIGLNSDMGSSQESVSPPAK